MKKGKNHHRWKGDNASYSAIHQWLRNNYGEIAICEHCNTKGFIEYASKRKIYTHDISEWFQLCRKCHSKYDKISQNLLEFNKKATENRLKVILKLKHFLSQGVKKTYISKELGISLGHVYLLIKQEGL